MSEVLEKVEVTHGFIEFEVKSANKNSKKSGNWKLSSWKKSSNKTVFENQVDQVLIYADIF